MSKFASGKHSIAFCDGCGRQVGYKELSFEVENMVVKGLRVCDDCMDPDHPQYQVGRWQINDPQALENARPDRFNDRGLYGWNPLRGIEGISAVGRVRVVVP